MKKTHKTLAVVSTTIILTAALTFMATTTFYTFLLKPNKSSFAGSEKIFEALEVLDKSYYFEVDKEKLVDSVLDGLLTSLGDPYTSYMNEEQFAEFSQMVNGTYAGIGSIVSWDKELNAVVIAKPFENSPAQKAGLVKGDRIIKIDSEDLSEKDLDSAVTKLKGEIGTSVVLTVLKVEQTDTVDISVIRDEIQIPSVDSEMRGEIGYIAIAMFDPKTGEEFKEHLTTVLESGAKGIILDLRDNGGGRVDAVTAVANQLLSKGQMIFYTQNKNGKQVEHKAYGSGIDIPIVMLVNENTASASELLAGSLRDNKGSLLVGKNTFGKGVVQMTYPLRDGSVIKMTVEKYFTPNGSDINTIGLPPDYDVELKTSNDEQYQKAVEVIKTIIQK